MNNKIKKFTLKSILILLAIPIVILAIVSIIYFSIASHNGKLIKTSLKPFNSVFKSPDSFRILDTTKWTREETIKSPIFTFSDDISVAEKDVKIVENITNILNNKEYKSITKEESEKYYANPNEKVRFWLVSGTDPDDALEHYFPYEVLIFKDKTLYIMTSKGKEYRYLKSSLTYDEFKFIEDIYNKRYEEEHVNYYSSHNREYYSKIS